MEWLATLLTAFGVLVLLAPVAMLLGTFFVLVPLAHLVGRPPMVSRTRCTCPVSLLRVDLGFVSRAGADRPSDVLSCSLFGDGPVRCKKGCLEHATTRWTPSPMTPPYALVAGGTAVREAARPAV